MHVGSRARILILAAFFSCALAAVSGGLRAESGQAGDVPGRENVDGPKAARDIDRLVEVLKDDKKREMLIRRLESSAVETSSPSGATGEAEGDEVLSDLIWNDLAGTGEEALQTLEDTFTSPRALFVLGKRALLSLVLVLAAYFLWRLFKCRLISRLQSKWPVKVLLLIALVFAAGVGLFHVWGMDVRSLFGAEGVQSLLKSGLTIVLVLTAAYVLWEFTNHVLHRHLASLELSGDWDRRLKTVLPLLRNAVLVILSVLTLLIVLSELGINIAPLLAGAGIVGLAIGFGAQTLVKDLLTGFFVLLENTINIGDWVLLGGHDGQVEGLTIRHVTVRDIYGNLHTVPWSSVVTITNQTREFGYAVVEVGFAYRENIDEVIEVVKEVAEEMRRDPELSPDILSELQILGLIELGDSAVVVRTRFKTSPFMRWRLERDFRRRIKNRFDELGIEIPFPHQTVYFGENKQKQAPPARVEIHRESGRLPPSDPETSKKGGS